MNFVTGSGVEAHPVERLAALLARDDGFVWVDIDVCDEVATAVLSDVFGFHPLSVQDCAGRNRVPRVHPYVDHLFFVLHAPEPGDNGHVHFLELDQFIAPGYVVTVHGPLNPVLDLDVALRETRAVRTRIETGRARPAAPFELSYMVVSALARRMEAFVEDLTAQVWELEQSVTAGNLGDPEQFLEELFHTRHGLLTVGIMAAQSRELYGRMAALGRVAPPERPLLDDLIDQFDRVRALANSQKDYLQGVIDFYRSRTDTKMMIAAERLAVVAVVTLPITALASVYGMNIIVNDRTDIAHVTVVVALMAAMSGLLLAWAKRHGWW